MSYISFQPHDHFDVKLWTGNGSSQTITGYEFQPDLAWIKARTSTGWHDLTDAVRGVTKSIFSNSANAEDTAVTSLTAFTSDGYSFGTNSQVNANGINYVGWNWKANGQGSSNTDGSINTTYTSANTTSGFSISTYSGTGSDGTIGHGLGVAPKMVMVKSLTSTSWWMVYHASLGNDKEIYLNQTNASGSSTTWNTTTPTSSLISLDGGAGNGVNASGQNYVCYAFAEKTGFSKFGSYTGNGNADGGFLFCGFKPALVIIKKTTGADNWIMFDNKRDTDNVVGNYLFPNTTAANASGTYMDFVSNGFKLRTSDGWVNNGSHSYIYMAFAEEPLVSSNGTPATAR